jgi:hypothetical protein
MTRFALDTLNFGHASLWTRFALDALRFGLLDIYKIENPVRFENGIFFGLRSS